jgi:hypothetical protein
MFAARKGFVPGIMVDLVEETLFRESSRMIEPVLHSEPNK